MDTDIIDKLFLELSQFTKATTKKELDLQQEIKQLKFNIKKLEDILANIRPQLH